MVALGAPSPPCASRIGGPCNDKHGSTPSQGQTRNLSSRTKPLGRIRSQALPRYPCPPSSCGWQAPSGGAQPPTLQASLLSSWSTAITRGTTPTMGCWEPPARVMGWPRKDGDDVHALCAASKAQDGPRVCVQVRLRRPKARRSRNGVLSADRSRQEMVQPANASPQPTHRHRRTKDGAGATGPHPRAPAESAESQ